MVNEWTVDDLPSLSDVLGEVSTQELFLGARDFRRATLDHLNKHHPKPATVPAERRYGDVVVGGTPSLRELSRALRERNEAVARAEAAEARPTVSRADVAEAISHEWYPRGDQGPDTCIDRVCALLGIESDPDPVLVKAQELWTVGRESDAYVWDDMHPSAQAEYKRIAAHLLGQGAVQ